MPSPATVARALELIGRGAVNHAYFFSKLESHEWIEPLVDQGFFRDPPPLRERGDLVHYPIWPESEYLARMAPIAPIQVAEVIRQIPETDNINVHRDLARAVIHLPGKQMARWAATEARWVSLQQQIRFPLSEALGTVVERLAGLGETRAAIELARALLTIRCAGDLGHAESVSGPPRFTESDAEISSSDETDEEDGEISELAALVVAGLSSRIIGLLNSYAYRQFVDRHVPALVEHGGIRTFEMLCDLLEDAIKSDKLQRYDGGLGRPAIEPHGQNHRDDVSDALIDAIRDASIQLVDSGVTLDAVVESLRSRTSPMFRRMTLHVVSEKHDHDPELAAELATCEEHYLDDRLLHEYSRLLGRVYPILDADRKDRVLTWISDGPPFQDSFAGDDDERRKWTIHWQRRRLAWIRPHLDEGWREQYARIVDEIGDPENPDFRSYTMTWMGPTSPVTAEDLGSLSAEEIARFVRSWRPTKDPMSPDPEGLARTLETVVAEAPSEFLEAHRAFLGGPVRYVSAVLRGLFQAVRDDVTIDWPTTIDLLSWLSARHSDDSALRSVRLDCMRLLEEGLKADLVDTRLRKAVWCIIDAIADDADPSPEAEARFASDDLPTHSINTVRGTALHAVVHYALWVYRSVSRNDEARLDAFDMDVIPEVRAKLERHLDPSIDPSPTIRSVFGDWFPHLVLLDEAWARQHVTRIFPNERPELRDAAWTTYLRSGRVYNRPFELLRDQYLAAVNRLDARDECDSITTERIGGFLGAHLIILAGRGLIEWSDDDGLLRQFFEKAEPDDTRQPLWLIGRDLSKHENDISDEALGRYKTIAENLLRLLEDDGRERMGHLSLLGWWIASGRFDAEWTLDRLERLVETAGAAEPSFAVMDCLVKLSKDHPGEVFNVFRIWVDADGPDRSVLFGRNESGRAILQAALAHPSAEQDARLFIDQLLAAGDLDFRDLLEP